MSCRRAKKRSRAYKLTPEFETATTRYAVNVRANVTSLRVNTATEHAGSVLEVGGKAADGQPLVLDGSQLSGLAIGTNNLEIAVTSEDGTAKSVYTVAITRPVPDDDASLHELQLSGGPPSPGFFASAMAGKLPPGEFDAIPGVRPRGDFLHRCRDPIGPYRPLPGGPAGRRYPVRSLLRGGRAFCRKQKPT